MDKQISHDKLHDESKTRTHRFSKLPEDGDPWAPNIPSIDCQILLKYSMFITVSLIVQSRNVLD